MTVEERSCAKLEEKGWRFRRGRYNRRVRVAERLGPHGARILYARSRRELVLRILGGAPSR